jgi:hypothetical protein
MVVGRLRKDRCWEVVLPKGEIRVDKSRPVLDFLLPGTPASLIVGGVLQPAIWEPKGSGFAVRQYLQLDSSTL